MPTQQKVDQVNSIQGWIDKCTIAISTDHTGLNVTDMNLLRKSLRESGIEYRVIKNRLAHIAADNSTKPEIKEIVKGPTGIAFGYDDPLAPAKVLSEFVKSTRSPLIIRGAVMGQSVLTADQVQALADLPSKEELLSRLLGQLNAPITSLLYVLNGPVQGLARVLSRRIETMPEEENAD
ncbi:MAG: 50S ribosomal protein L10 [Chloroflexota bacterium]|nr:50S ribosomal protein L10 [Chloroflexota bacterium]